jgi:hypothetical protein
MLPAGIQKNSLDIGFPRYDESDPDTQFYGGAIWVILGVGLTILLLFCSATMAGEHYEQDSSAINAQGSIRDDLLGVYSLPPKNF